jgi:hypothetical protein
MRIPREYFGCWCGEITDSKRQIRYSGQITVSADGISTAYNQSHGLQTGDLTEQYLGDGILVYKEVAGSWCGTLLLCLDDNERLRCVWRSTKNNSFCEATMSRALDG